MSGQAVVLWRAQVAVLIVGVGVGVGGVVMRGLAAVAMQEQALESLCCASAVHSCIEMLRFGIRKLVFRNRGKRE